MNAMIRTMYIIVLIYFLLGFIAFYFINRKKEPLQARKSWIKTITYFFIINLVFFSIVINPIVFRYLAVIVIIAGFLELFKLFRESGYKMKNIFMFSTIIFTVFSFGFFVFSGMEKGLILFTFMILSIFDSFSQITGELLGRKKLFPKISPQKTVEGLIGGAIVAILSALLLKSLISAPSFKAMLMAAGVVIFAFIGDISKSYYKRKYNVKDFSNLIPENGGFLDRFDSLIAGGAWITLLRLLINV
jgi:phosphatidate cytidylyltransferase